MKYLIKMHYKVVVDDSSTMSTYDNEDQEISFLVNQPKEILSQYLTIFDDNFVYGIDKEVSKELEEFLIKLKEDFIELGETFSNRVDSNWHSTNYILKMIIRLND